MQITTSNLFSSRLKQLRQAKGLSQKQLAIEINSAERTIQSYELNVRTPSIDICITLTNYFNVSLDYLVGLTDNPARL